MLFSVLEKILQTQGCSSAQIQQTWAAIAEAYSAPTRHYHTLQHLEEMYHWLLNVQDALANKEAVGLALFYHDIVYQPRQTDNEEQSAILAEKHLLALGFPETCINLCKKHIIASKNHLPTNNQDTDLFTDADLAILGQPWEKYVEYCQQIRQEYAMYPDVLYRAGRANVLKHFLNLNRLYKTPYFFNQFEQQAKQNLAEELKILT